ncbi:MAG: hypothetical protein UW45_C0010G0032 [Parcubacteria group bacterium GW2011_GWC2_44_22]|nr:MAG: hypothetical protein UW45_C0010G0032 [Parcubacteria group bacterium GW2011_GWC2_44_22]
MQHTANVLSSKGLPGFESLPLRQVLHSALIIRRKNMRLKKITPNIMVADVNATVCNGSN